MKLKKNCKWLITRKKKWMEIYKNFHKAPFNICRTKKENDRKLHSEGKITFRILLLQTFLNKKNCSKLIFTSCLDKKRCDSKKWNWKKKNICDFDEIYDFDTRFMTISKWRTIFHMLVSWICVFYFCRFCSCLYVYAIHFMYRINFREKTCKHLDGNRGAELS